MSKHTPGPWKAREQADGGVMVEGARGEDIAFDLLEANARLIAAAPELLGAAKACLPYFDLMWPPEDATGERSRLREALRAAIAKAEVK